MAGPPGQQRDPAASHADDPARASTPLTGRFLPRYDFAVVHTDVFRLRRRRAIRQLVA